MCVIDVVSLFPFSFSDISVFAFNFWASFLCSGFSIGISLSVLASVIISHSASMVLDSLPSFYPSHISLVFLLFIVISLSALLFLLDLLISQFISSSSRSSRAYWPLSLFSDYIVAYLYLRFQKYPAVHYHYLLRVTLQSLAAEWVTKLRACLRSPVRLCVPSCSTAYASMCKIQLCSYDESTYETTLAAAVPLRASRHISKACHRAPPMTVIMTDWVRVRMGTLVFGVYPWCSLCPTPRNLQHFRIAASPISSAERVTSCFRENGLSFTNVNGCLKPAELGFRRSKTPDDRQTGGNSNASFSRTPVLCGGPSSSTNTTRDSTTLPSAAMHPCLFVQEVIREICEYSNGRTSLAMALSCRAFLEPALDSIWREITSIRPFVACFPQEFWETAHETFYVIGMRREQYQIYVSLIHALSHFQALQTLTVTPYDAHSP